MGGIGGVVQLMTDLMANLFVPALVWALSIAGLAWVVQDRVREEEQHLLEGDDSGNGGWFCAEW